MIDKLTETLDRLLPQVKLFEGNDDNFYVFIDDTLILSYVDHRLVYDEFVTSLKSHDHIALGLVKYHIEHYLKQEKDDLKWQNKTMN